MMAPLMEVRELKVHFPAGRGAGRTREWLRAVDGVSFSLNRGETLGLVGESGCGKSTTARAILRLIEPTEGTVLFEGTPLGLMTPDQLRTFRRQVQIVFQDPFSSLNPRMTVGQMLMEALAFHRLAGDARGRRRRAGELLERVGLHSDHLDRYPHEFSGGQRQRVGIARALSVEPRVLVLDEPVSALDVSVRAQVVNLLQELQREFALTYLFVAHDLSLVEHVSDRVAVMYLGRIVELGGVGQIFENPTHPYTRALLSAAPVPDPSGRSGRRRIILEGDVPSPVHRSTGCPFHSRCPHLGRDERCLAAVPALREVSEEQLVACIKVETNGQIRG